MSTYEPIASQTLGSAAASVTFSSIPQGYTDLVLVTTANVSATGYTKLYFNGLTTNIYSATNFYGDGTNAGSARATTGSALGFIQCHYLYTGSNQAILQINLQNYSNSTTFKTCLIKESDATYELTAKAGLWQSTNAITSLTLERVTGNWTSGSTFSIYGIQVGQAVQKAQGGNIVTTDGTYVYHTFTSSGAFIPSQALTADYLVVAGGGGGGGAGAGGRGAGGGGAGGLRSTVTATGGGGSLESALSLTAKSYSVVVGAGGTGGTANIGTKGGDSVFATITSAGGGYGGAWNTADGIAPSSGGAGGGMPDGQAMSPTTGAAGTANQGYKGGDNAGDAGGNAGSGGGGAGSAGTNLGSAASTGSAGGTGVAVSISGSSITYAAGGAGGNQSGNQIPSNATANTGNGGGGKGGGAGLTNGVGANGGSGIVIIRYLA